MSQYLAQAMGCFIEAVQIEANEASCVHLPRCLWMLAKDGSSPGVICQTLENRAAALPPWVWLPWIPQLLTSLCRVEGRSVRSVLSGLVKSYPQAVYFSLRAFYLERRDVERSRASPSNPGQHHGSVAFAEELMSSLRRSHASLWSALEAILEELIMKFRPSYEEELLGAITALLERAEAQAERSHMPDKSSNEDEEAMVASITKTIARVAAKFFRSSSADSGNKRDERAKKTAEFKRRYRAVFESDFLVLPIGASSQSLDQGASQLGLVDYLSRLRKWKRHLEGHVSSAPLAIPLVEASPTLATFAASAPDLWTGSCDPRQLSSALTNREPPNDGDGGLSQQTTSSSAKVALKAAVNAALTVARNAATEGVGGDYGGGSASIEVPGQYAPCSIACSKPTTELHVKLIRFEPKVEILRRNEQLVRRIGMIGSDGKTYHFLLQFAIPYWTRADERTVQMTYVMDQVLRKDVISLRKHLSVKPTAVIPIAQRLRMTADSTSRVSLDDVFRQYCDRIGKRHDFISSHFHEEVVRRRKEKSANDASVDPNAEDPSKLEVFKEICKTKVNMKVLLDYMHATLDGQEPLFQFRRVFSSQLAANSLLQYCFCTVERSPSRLAFMRNNAQVLSPDFRVSYTNQGKYLHSLPAPHRILQNSQLRIATRIYGDAGVAVSTHVESPRTPRCSAFRGTIHTSYVHNCRSTKREQGGL